MLFGYLFLFLTSLFHHKDPRESYPFLFEVEFSEDVVGFIFKHYDIIQVNGETPVDVYDKAASGVSRLYQFLQSIAKAQLTNGNEEATERPHHHDGHYVDQWLRRVLGVPDVKVFHMCFLCTYMCTYKVVYIQNRMHT